MKSREHISSLLVLLSATPSSLLPRKMELRYLNDQKKPVAFVLAPLSILGLGSEAVYTECAFCSVLPCRKIHGDRKRYVRYVRYVMV